ncbi:glycosyltransferase family 4 protein [Enterovirga aerilata]|uniref:Glycosyltransferase family 4 protein n=1 Tax=Enterovirga aerilata TaxID=2730920 RepID=A0A849I4N3_9HYPH|nr:glycosyltransferase family 4 protein [Enterovirga sp. DB1703]NNM71285.1 glycosyltransferase family 4 protein [Enterovirga sp. DB1703]
MTEGRRTRIVAIASPGGRSAGGGMGTVSRLIADGLEGAGSGYGAVILDPRGAGSPWLWPAFFLGVCGRLGWLWARARLSVLHLQVSERSSFIRKGLLLALGRALRVPVVLHHHGAELIPTYAGGPRWLRAIMRRTIRGADLNIVLGDVWRRFLVEEIAADPAKVVVLANASADLGSRSPPEPSQGARPGLLMLANLSPRKGVGELLAALARLREEGLDVPTMLAGGGEVERYRAEAARLGIADLCTFTGWVGRAEVERLLGQARALVLPSYEEGLPMAILEALSAGVPVVATPVGSIPENLTNGETCLLVQPGNVDELVSALRAIMTDEHLRERLVRNGRALFEKRFAPGAYIQAVVAMYDRLGAGRP